MKQFLREAVASLKTIPRRILRPASGAMLGTAQLRTRSNASWEAYWEQDEEFRYVLFEGGPDSPLAGARSELLGKRRWEIPDCAPIDSTWNEHRERLEAREEFQDFVFRMGTGRTARFLSVSGAPRYGTNGAFSGYSGIARDITLRMRAEQRARETQTTLEIASRLGHLGAWAVDVPEMTVTWSTEALAIHELEEGAPLTVEGVCEQIQPGWRAKVEAALQHCIRAGTPFDIEAQVYTARRKLIWVRLIGEALRDLDGGVRRVHGAVQDISERKIQAERHRELGERLTSTLESVTDAFFTVDREWKFTYVNREAERLMQRPRADLLGRVIWEQFPQAVDTRFHREFERALAEHVTVEFEEFYPPLQFWARVTAYPSAQGLAVYYRDVTESTNAGQVLARSEERYRLLFESSIDAIFHTCPDGKILSANSAACAMFRMTEEELRRAGRKRVIAPDDPRLSSLLEERRRLGKARGELTMVRGDGTRFEVEITSAHYRDSDGALFTMVAVRDMTERIQQRNEILRLNSELSMRVRHRTAELEAANAQLKGFAYSLAHDLRSPISAINVFGETLEGLLATTAGERELHYTRRIRAAGQRMDDFVTALLALASLSQADLQLSEVNLSEIARTIFADLQEQAESRRVVAAVQDGLMAWGDARLLRMALENLLGNAWKFTARREVAQISFTARDAVDGEVVYCIEDNGAGFDMAYADKLFGNFQRLHSDADFPGMGIGLANVHRIIGRHAGRVWAESAEGSGARFYFTLAGCLVASSGLETISAAAGGQTPRSEISDPMTSAFDSPFALSPDSITVRFVHHAAYLEAVVAGFKSPAGVAAVIARIGDETRKSKAERVLIDVRQAVGQMSMTDHADVGVVLAHHLGAVRCAVVARADRPRGEIEPAARQGGLDYKPFDESGEAVEWLLQGVTR